MPLAADLLNYFGARAAGRASTRATQAQYNNFANELRAMFDQSFARSQAYDADQFGYERNAIGQEDTTLRAGFDRLLGLDSSSSDAARAARTAAGADARGIQANTLDRVIGQTQTGAAGERSLESATYREGFNRLLDQTREQGAIEDTRFSTNMGRNNALMDTLDRVRNGSLALSAEERARQEDFQSQADSLTAAFIGQSGTTGFSTDMAAAEGQLAGLVRSNIPHPTDVPGAQSADPRIKADRARQQTRAIDDALNEADKNSKMIAYGEGIRGQSRRQLGVGENLSILDDRAARSADNLAPQLGFLRLQGDNAVASTSAHNDVTDTDAETRAAILREAFRGTEGARTREAGTNLNALQDFNSGTLSNIRARGSADAEAGDTFHSALAGIDARTTDALRSLFESDTAGRAASGNNRWDRLISSTQTAASSAERAAAQREAIARDLFNTRVRSISSRNPAQTIGQVWNMADNAFSRLATGS